MFWELVNFLYNDSAFLLSAIVIIVIFLAIPVIGLRLKKNRQINKKNRYVVGTVDLFMYLHSPEMDPEPDWGFSGIHMDKDIRADSLDEAKHVFLHKEKREYERRYGDGGVRPLINIDKDIDLVCAELYKEDFDYAVFCPKMSRVRYSNNYVEDGVA